MLSEKGMKDVAKTVTMSFGGKTLPYNSELKHVLCNEVYSVLFVRVLRSGKNHSRWNNPMIYKDLIRSSLLHFSEKNGL